MTIYDLVMRITLNMCLFPEKHKGKEKWGVNRKFACIINALFESTSKEENGKCSNIHNISQTNRKKEAFISSLRILASQFRSLSLSFSLR